MAEVINPRAAGANTGNPYGLSDDAARLAAINVEMFNLKNTINANKPGSTKYKTALTKYNALKKEQSDLLAKGKAEVAAKKKIAADKAKTKAQEDLQRAEALGDEERAQKARDKITKAEKDALAAGKKTDADKKKDSDGDGIPDLTDNLPNFPNPDQKTGTGKATKKPKIPTKPDDGADTPPKVPDTPPKDDGKTLWVSWLRTTFNALDDKQQKAEIDGLLEKAIKGGWDEKTFTEALKGTSWWQSTLPSLRQFFLETNDPRNASTFAEKLKNNMDSVMSKLEALGIAPTYTDPQTGKVTDNTEFVKGIAMEAVKNNWDDDQLASYLATKGNLLFTGGGTIGSYLDRVKNTAYMYGVGIDANLEKNINMSLLDPLDGRDAQYWINSMKQMAIDAPQNKPFAESLKAGRSLYEVTTSYRNQMANLLEVDSAAITWDDLMGKVLDKDSGNARTFADFTKSLKQDPLWQYTKNAKETYSNMALDLAKMFGFSG
jgi:hypothetical protein